MHSVYSAAPANWAAGDSLEGVIPSTEVQSGYSTAPGNWATGHSLWETYRSAEVQSVQPKLTRPLIYVVARGVMVTVVENGHGDTRSNPELDWLYSHSTNTLGEGMNPTILPPAMGK